MITLLQEARIIRRQLLAHPKYFNTSIRDAIELAADNHRQLEDERRWKREAANEEWNY